jgi:hypothetical protein
MIARENDAGDPGESQEQITSSKGRDVSVPADVVDALYVHMEQMRLSFFGGDLPDAILSFDVADKRMRGSHRIQMDRLGRRWMINMNPVHLARPLDEILATLLHELIHVWQHECGTPSKAPYHNAAFRTMSAAFGIPVDERGHFLGVPCGTRFAQYCGASATTLSDEAAFHASNRGPHVSPVALATPVPKGSRLKKWTCACGVNVRVAVAAFDATCNRCGSLFRLVD